MELDVDQQEAIKDHIGETLVVAGAGSGKTRCLTEKIKKLVNDGMSSSRIVACTFTVAAAKEMMDRLEDITLHHCGTLHSWMLKLLQSHGGIVGLTGHLSVIDETEREELITDICKEMKYKGTRQVLDTQLSYGPFHKSEKLVTSKIDSVVMAYYRLLKANGMLDYDSILHYGLALLSKMNDDGVLAGLWDAVLIDEYQDTCPIDDRIYQQVAKACQRIFYCGDPDQSCYMFRGADPSIIVRKAKDSSIRTVLLQNNYRCGSSICHAAQMLIERNSNRVRKETRSVNGNEGSIVLLECRDDLDELSKICSDIRKAKDINKCAVLLRTNALVKIFAEGLKTSGVKIWERERRRLPTDWGATIALIGLLANPGNDVLAYAFLKRLHGEKEAIKVKRRALERCEPISKLLSIDPDSPRIEAIPNILAQHVGPESVAMVGQALELLDSKGSALELSLALGRNGWESEKERNGVTVSTIHKAKGLEFDTVYVPALEEGTLPFFRNDISEEYRLGYVAFTRAKDKLVLSYTTKRRDPYSKKVISRRPSRFLTHSGIAVNLHSVN